MSEFTVKTYDETLLKSKYDSYVLGADIGGTNTNLAIAGIKGLKPQLLFSCHFKTQKLESVIPSINKTLEYAAEKHGITIEYACIGAAGVVNASKYFVKLTNASWNISKKEILEKTLLKNILLLNDFQIIGYGINLLNPNNQNDIFQIRQTPEISTHTTKAIIGAGTGLGKSILIYDKNLNAYIPLPSEGGHTDTPVYNNKELELLDFIKKQIGCNKPVTYEEIVSGRGLENIYQYVRNKQQLQPTLYTEEIDNSDEKASLISKYKETDENCKETFKIFTKFYARCIKNFVLDTMSTGGIYITGGIAAKNKEIFTTKEFCEELENAHQRNDVLKNIPIYVIVNYDVSLLGACLAAMHSMIQNNKSKILS